MKWAIGRVAVSGAILAALVAASWQLFGPAEIRAQADNECTGSRCLCSIEEVKVCWLWIFCDTATIPRYYGDENH